MKTSRMTLFAIIGAAVAIAGCRSIDTSIFGGSFGRNSSAMTAGGAVAGQDYVIGLRPSEAAQQYFASASLSSDGAPVTVTPGDDKGTGVVWTDDGGIVIPPGTTIEFTNKGCCLDPHLPAPKADEEMQFIKTSCLIPTELQGTYKNLLRRAAAGDEDVKSNLQHLMWTLRTAGSNDAYAKNLTDRQREILAECAEAGSFDGYCQDLHRFDELKKLVMAHVGQVAEKLQIEVGNVTYKASDLLDPELGKQKVAAHLGELIHMNEYLPVVHSGFNYGELQKGIYTDIKGNGTLSFKAKVANSTSESFVFYPMDYVAQVGSGQNMQSAFFAAADSSMKQRTTTGEQNRANVRQDQQSSSRIIENWESLSCDEKIRLYNNGRIAASVYKDDYNGMNHNEWEDENEFGFNPANLRWLNGSVDDAGKRVQERWNEILQNYQRETGSKKGLFARVYKDFNDNLILAFRGTEPTDLKDLRADKQLMSDSTTEQWYARQLVRLIADNANEPIIVTGHSLGGYLAVVGSIGVDNIKAVYTYNAPGLDSIVLNRFPSGEVDSTARKTINLWHSADPIHLANESFVGGDSDYSGDKHIGRRVELSGYAGFGDRLAQLFPINPFREHSIDLLNKRMLANMGGCM